MSVSKYSRPVSRIIIDASALTSGLSSAVTARAGGALIEPMVAESIMPALDSNPTNIIDGGWGQDGLRNTTKSSIRKSCPNLTEKWLSVIPVAN